MKIAVFSEQPTRAFRLGAFPRAITAGVLSGSLSVAFAISFAVLAYAGLPDRSVGLGIGFTLLGAAILTGVLAVLSSHAGMVAILQSSPTAVVALMVASVTGVFAGRTSEATTFVNVLATIMFATMMVGVVLFILGTLRFGRLVRFIPYPVIGGFLAGTGWLVLKGGFGLMTNLPLTFHSLPAYFQPENVIRWLPGIAFAVVLVAVMRRRSQPMLVPGLILAAMLVFHGIFALARPLLSAEAQSALFLGPFPAGIFTGLPLFTQDFSLVDWPLVVGQSTQLVALVVVSMFSLLLNSSAVELASRRDIDLNLELKSAGVANIAAAIAGGLPGYQGVSSTLIGLAMQANSRLVGLVAALIPLAVVVLGDSFLSLLPKAVVGGVVAYLGFNLLIEWLYDAWRRMSRSDYFVLVLIFVVTIFVGYLEGVTLGILTACILFLVEYSQQSVVRRVYTGDVYRRNIVRPRTQFDALWNRSREILIFELHGYIFFGTANSLLELIQQRVMAASDNGVRYLILDFRQVTNVDSSAMLSFTRLNQWAETQGLTLLFTSLLPKIARQLRVHEASIRQSFAMLPEVDAAIEWCENQILAGENAPRPGRSAMTEYIVDALGGEAGMALIKRLECQEVDAGSYLVRQGDETYDLYFVESGRLSVQVTQRSGKSIRVASAGAGSVLGEIGIYMRSGRTASIIADVPSTVYRLTPDALESIEKAEPTAAAALHRYLARVLAARLAASDTML